MRKKSLTKHPSERFTAPAGIQRGVPLRELIGREMVELIGESMEAVARGFDRKRFVREAMEGLGELELMERGQKVALALSQQLPADFTKTARILIASLGPELSKTEGNGLAPFFYLPHALLIAKGTVHFEIAMKANYELAKRFTAEFSIRPYIAAYPERSLKLLEQWAEDANPHVRRAASEGTRPRLPWAMRLKAIQENPRLTLKLLEKLKDDPELYVRRSVANHLADILKDHPHVAYEVCERWLAECNDAARRWIVKHAVRLLAKKDEKRALMLRKRCVSD